jgi:hypothetical protein
MQALSTAPGRCLDDGGSKHLWNVGKILPDYMAQQPRRQPSSLIYLFICGLLMVVSVAQIIGLMNNELERIRKESAVF